MHTSIGRILRSTDPEHFVMKDQFGEHGERDVEFTRLGIRTMLQNVAHYVADQKITDLAESVDCRRTLNAMGKAGIRRLPFDPILIEFMQGSMHVFVRLQSEPLGHRWKMPGKMGADDFYPDICAYVCAWKDHPLIPGEIMVASLPIDTPINIVWGTLEDRGFKRKHDPELEPDRAYTVLISEEIMDGRAERARYEMEYQLYLNVGEAMALAMMMLNTKGIVTERIDTAKLNRAQTKRGVPASQQVQSYHVMRIGHVYDRSGAAHSVAGSGRHMPVHWRAGHIRNVPYGPYAVEHRPTRVVFIQPCLVNFDPATDDPAGVPLPKKEVVL